MHAGSKVVSARKSTVKTQPVLTTVSVLMEFAFARKVGRVKTVQLKTKLRFPASQHVQTTESSTCTPKNVLAIPSSAVMIVRWSFAT